jgi:hypothetical protein
MGIASQILQLIANRVAAKGIAGKTALPPIIFHYQALLARAVDCNPAEVRRTKVRCTCAAASLRPHVRYVAAHSGSTQRFVRLYSYYGTVNCRTWPTLGQCDGNAVDCTEGADPLGRVRFERRCRNAHPAPERAVSETDQL